MGMERRLEAQLAEASILGVYGKGIPPHLCLLREPHGVT